MLVSDIIYNAQRLGGVLKLAGRTASTYESADALAALNGMLDSWRTERLLVYGIARQTYAFAASQASYSIGQDGDFNAARPVRIERAGVLLATSGEEMPVELLDFDQWAHVPLKGQTATYPTAMHDDRAFPLAGLHFWPIPTDVGNQAVLYVWQPLGGFAAASDSFSFPDGYQDAITYGLAVRLAALHPGAAVSPLIVEQAREAKAAIKRANMPSLVMSCDPALVGGLR